MLSLFSGTGLWGSEFFGEQGTAAFLTAFWPNESQIGAVFSLFWVGGCVWGLVQTQHAVFRSYRLTCPHTGWNPSLVVMLLSFLHMTAKLFLSFLLFLFFFLSNSFIEMQFTYPTSHAFKSVQFSGFCIFMELCNHHYNPF